MGNTLAHSTAKNTLFMTSASILQKIISFVYFTLIARSIGVEGTGKYFLALSFTTIFVVFVDLGMTNVLVREASRVKDHIQKYLSTVLAVKLVLGVLAYGSVLVVSSILYSDSELRQMIWLSGFTMLFDSFNWTVYGVLRALGDLRFESISITASQLLSLIFGGIFLFFHFPLIYLILAFTLPSACNAVYATFIVYRRFGCVPIPKFHRETFKILWAITIPFALAAIFARVYGYIDTLFLKQILGSEAVGYYSTPYKITFAFQFIPLALTAALYPRLSECFLHAKDTFISVLHDSIKYLLVVSMPISIGIAVLARPIILFLFTDTFLPSVLPLQILIVSLVFSFLSFPIGAALNASDRQKTQTTIVGFVMIINILLNLWLIPQIGVSGAAISALVGNFLLTFLGYIYLSQSIKIDHTMFVFTFLKVLISGIIMGAGVLMVFPVFGLFGAIFFGILLYILMILLTRTIIFSELKGILKMFKS